MGEKRKLKLGALGALYLTYFTTELATPPSGPAEFTYKMAKTTV
jgi:hypothetical protein